MKILGIIAEYNPFHNGHLHHLQKSKELINPDFVVVILSGSFTQRVEPSVVSKWDRAKMALLNGADLVIELPSIFATGAAEDFAYGSIRLLKELKVVNYLSFGSTNGNLSDLEMVADIFLDQPPKFLRLLEKNLATGSSYSASLAEATSMYLKSEKFSNILNDPNNILGIEYIKQIKKQELEITAITVKRDEEASHNSLNLSHFASGKRIRQALLNGENIQNSVPANVYNILKQNENKLNFGLDSIEQIILHTLRSLPTQYTKNIYNVSEGLENRLKKAALISGSLEELYENTVSKRYTKSKIKRCIFNIMQNLTKKDMQSFKKERPYARILGFNKNGKSLIPYIAKQNPKLDLIISVSSFEKATDNKVKEGMLQKDINATDLFSLATFPFLNSKLDYTTKVVDIDNDMF